MSAVQTHAASSPAVIDYESVSRPAGLWLLTIILLASPIVHLTAFALDVVLITALYVVLMPVNRSLALVAMGWGLIETAILVLVTLSDLEVLRILSGANYLHAFEADRLQALARLSISAHADTYNVGLVLAGLRSISFCYLWFKSGFIPRALSGWGMLASFLMGICAFFFIIFPELAKVIPVEIYGAPIFFFEMTMGFWILLKGLKPSGTPHVS